VPADVGIPSSTNSVKLAAAGPTVVWNPPIGVEEPGCPATPSPVFDRFTYYINVMITEPLSQVSLSGTNLLWNLSQGNPGRQFRVVSATNLLQPLTNWIVLSTNTLDYSGQCTLAFPVNPDEPYRLFGVSFPAP